MKSIAVIMLFVLNITSCSSAEVKKDIEKKANYLCSLIAEKTDLRYEKHFDEKFRKTLTNDRLIGIFQDIYKENGKCINIAKVEGSNPYQILVKTKKSNLLKFTLSLGPNKSLINGLWYKGIVNDKTEFNKFSDFICSSLVEKPSFSYKNKFHSSFRKAITYDELVELLSVINKEFGLCRERFPKSDNGISGELITKHNDNIKLKFTLTLSKEDGQYKIAGLRFLGKETKPIIIKNYIDLKEKLVKMDGNTSFLFLKNKSNELFSFKSEEKHALGSVFKLYILAALIEKIKDGDLFWNQKFKIENKLKSLPSGNMQNLKEGTEVTLIDFASKMISISDNTATDHSLNIVTKKYVEQLMGDENLNSFPFENLPFLSTLDMFKTRGYFHTKEVIKYTKANRDERVRLIANTPFTTRNKLSRQLKSWTSPRYIDQIEWFASAKDICNLYDWMDAKNDTKFRSIIGINTPFIDIEKSKKWTYAGYKGGSEPGVLEMSYFLEDKNGEKYCLYIGQNNSKKPINTEKFFALVEGIFNFLESE